MFRFIKFTQSGASAAFVLLLTGLTHSLTVSATELVPPVKPKQFIDQPDSVGKAGVPVSKPGHRNPAKEGKELYTSDAYVCEVQGAVIEEPRSAISISDSEKGCGIASPIRLKGVLKGETLIEFSVPVTVSCEFAKIFTSWIVEDVLPSADRHIGSAITVFDSGPGYQCRRRNNRADGKLSEHALGKAIDLSGFHFENGSRVSVRDDWEGKSAKGRFLDAVHLSACKRFTTVLGPNADANHKSHFHLDIGCHGKDCTYLICQ